MGREGTIDDHRAADPRGASYWPGIPLQSQEERESAL